MSKRKLHAPSEQKAKQVRIAHDPQNKRKSPTPTSPTRKQPRLESVPSVNVTCRIRYPNGSTCNIDLERSFPIANLAETVACLRQLETLGLEGLAGTGGDQLPTLYINYPARAIKPHETLGQLADRYQSRKLTMFCFK